MCLKILTDNACKEIEDSVKVLAAKFIKNVVMTQGDQHMQHLQHCE